MSETREEKWDGWEGPIVEETSDKDIEIQDFIDNTIHNMICEIVGRLTGQRVPWNIAVIHEVLNATREALWKHYQIRIPYAAMDITDEN